MPTLSVKEGKKEWYICVLPSWTRQNAAIAAVSHRTREDVMKNLFQIEHRIAAVYSLAALHVGGRILH